MILIEVINLANNMSYQSNFTVSNIDTFIDKFFNLLDKGIYAFIFDNNNVIICIKDNHAKKIYKINNIIFQLLKILLTPNKQLINTNLYKNYFNISDNDIHKINSNIINLANNPKSMLIINKQLPKIHPQLFDLINNKYSLIGGGCQPSEWTQNTIFLVVNIILTIISMVPVVGIPADIISGIMSFFECDYFGVFLSVLGVIPVAGIAADSVKILYKIISYIIKFSKKAKKAKKYYKKAKDFVGDG